jgi:hypothetical protein
MRKIKADVELSAHRARGQSNDIVTPPLLA